MADFCSGFAYECDVSAPLTIEGNEVRRFKREADGGAVSGELPWGERIVAASVEELVNIYLERTGAIAHRASAKTAHLRHLREGREAWNQWRRDHPETQPMLACVNRHEFEGMRLDGYDFSYTNLCEAKLQGIHLERANFHQAILAGTNLSYAHLEGANFCRTDLYKTQFRNACLKGANLQGVQLAMTDFTGADLSGCKVYGLSAWDLQLTGAKQENLIVKYRPVGSNEEEVVVESVDLAAFMYLTLTNRNISRIVEAASRKWVLILGRFTEGKDILEKIADALKQRQFIPIKFDFDRPEHRDLIETIILLAGMSAFVIAEISNPRSTPLELQAIASNYGVPIFPIMKRGSEPFGMFSGLRKFRWVFPPLEYDSADDLIRRLPNEVIAPALQETQRLAEAKRSAETS